MIAGAGGQGFYTGETRRQSLQLLLLVKAEGFSS